MESLEPKGPPRLGIVKRHRTTLCTLVLGVSALLPASALAGGPLLSGYGGPGAGAQAIVGATLLNGPGGGSGGSSSSSGSTGSSAGSPGVGAPSGGGSQSGAGTASGGGGGAGVGPGPRSSHPHGSGARVERSRANPTSSRSGVSAAASIGTEASWFSGADLLALVLAAGALALMAVATVRLGRTHNDEG